MQSPCCKGTDSFSGLSFEWRNWVAQVYFLEEYLVLFEFMEDTDKELEQNVDFDWYLMLLAVAPKHQRQGHGSRFMTEGIEPFLEEIQGKKTSLLYQYQRKCLFLYQKWLQGSLFKCD